jgi:hypothetical protein
MTTEQDTTSNPFESADRWEPFLDRYIREEGNYVFTIQEAEDASSQQGKPQIFLQLEASAGTIRDWVNYSAEHLGKVTSLYEAAGVRIPQPGEFDPGADCRLTSACIGRLVGRKVGGVVRLEDSFKDPSKQILRVKGYVQTARLTDDAPADTRGLPSAEEISSSANPDEPDIPF